MNADPPPPASSPPSSPPAAPGRSSGDAPEIRHAATVVVLRPGAAGHEVYMLQRSARSPFMPLTLVFPGGRLDPEDGPAHEDASWERAARRECAEEAGLDLRDRPLRWFDTWLTPSAESRRRYLARFFLAQLDAGEGGEAKADGFETHAGRWATAAAHLDAWAAERVDLPPPTVAVLLRLREANTEGLAVMHAGDPRDPILPKLVPRGREPVILMPHDPEYDHTPGDSAPAPARAHALPTRFVRDGRRWRPC